LFFCSSIYRLRQCCEKGRRSGGTSELERESGGKKHIGYERKTFEPRAHDVARKPLLPNPRHNRMIRLGHVFSNDQHPSKLQQTRASRPISAKGMIGRLPGAHCAQRRRELRRRELLASYRTGKCRDTPSADQTLPITS
jgi:hypothetical protein